jgi:ABC-type sugar transport system permease subunit
MKKRKVGLMGRRAVYGYLFILPFIIGFVFFMLKPLAQSFRMSISEVTISTQGFALAPNGFENYKRALFVDADYTRMLLEGLGQMVLRSFATVIFSFFVALLLNQNFKGRTLARSIFFLAVILSSGVLVGLENNNSLMAQLKDTIEEAGSANSITTVLERILVPSTQGLGGIGSKTFSLVF